MTHRREYKFTVEEHGNETQVQFIPMSEEMMAMDLIIIAMKTLKVLGQLVPPAQPKVQAALEALKLDQVYDPYEPYESDALN